MPSTWTIALASLCGLGIAHAGFASPLAGSQPETVLHVRAEFVAEAVTIRPGVPFRAGLHLVIDRGWHVNWRNPGDAGLAPSLTWELPPGFTAGPIEWPVPRRIVEGTLVSYGYEDEIFLPFSITPPDSLAKDTSFDLKADVNWLECSEVCIPGKARLQLTLSTRADQERPGDRYLRLYAGVESRLPRPTPSGSFAARFTPTQIVLEGREPATAPIDTVLFFPLERGLIDNAAPQRWSTEDVRLIITMTRPVNRGPDPRLFEGVLYLAGGPASRIPPQVLAVTAPVANSTGTAGSLALIASVVALASGVGWLAVRRRKSAN